jgi:hypothetical protein
MPELRRRDILKVANDRIEEYLGEDDNIIELFVKLLPTYGKNILDIYQHISENDRISM